MTSTDSGYIDSPDPLQMIVTTIGWIKGEGFRLGELRKKARGKKRALIDAQGQHLIARLRQEKKHLEMFQ